MTTTHNNTKIILFDRVAVVTLYNKYREAIAYAKVAKNELGDWVRIETPALPDDSTCTCKNASSLIDYHLTK